MIKAVIFDLNGVLIQSPLFSDIINQKFHVPSEEFLPALKEIMAITRKPFSKESYDLWQPYLKRWHIKLKKEQFFEFWFSSEHINVALFNYIKQLTKEGLKIFLLSNNFRERTLYYRENFPKLFQTITKSYFSWETGYIKPDIEAYKKILHENNLDGRDCLYFDDSQQNINVAVILGIKGYKYVSVQETKRIIEKNLN